jgi:hypothetical protein
VISVWWHETWETVSKVTALIRLCFPQASRFVDYGGGYGMFVRLMRDKGFDFYRSDKYAKNLFAKQFEASETISYDLLTAFEVFEHLVNPTDEVERMLKLSDAIFLAPHFCLHINLSRANGGITVWITDSMLAFIPSKRLRFWQENLVYFYIAIIRTSIC